ncbi:hypothetical protein [Streptosporangium amethystogenes]|uniref:hypothetical protein n=1 Tax=Streptosporangium amethystogenes TaxID=2002 RepID=UPI0006912AA3|nr:hypothetical protein [Streptosporangium amethystogenes]
MLSYSCAVSGAPLLGETIGENFERIVARFGDREALVDLPGERRWTYAELNADVTYIDEGSWHRLPAGATGVGPESLRSRTCKRRRRASPIRQASAPSGTARTTWRSFRPRLRPSAKEPR